MNMNSNLSSSVESISISIKGNVSVNTSFMPGYLIRKYITLT